jgi:hypothetical protein
MFTDRRSNEQSKAREGQTAHASGSSAVRPKEQDDDVSRQASVCAGRAIVVVMLAAGLWTPFR